LPARLRTLAQSFRGRTYYYAPVAGGRARLGRLLSWRFDAELFPDLGVAPVLAAFKVESFRMTFPVAVVTG
jgi:GTP-sensing pleiotropic transcriptional regulator CodY